MNRPLRILLNVATALSALLCILSFICKVRGSWIEDYAYRGKSNGPAAVIFSGHGSLWIGIEGQWPAAGAGKWQWASESISAARTYTPAIATTAPYNQWSLPGVSWIRTLGWIARPPGGPIVATPGMAPSIVAISIDWWLLITLCALLPLARIVRRLMLQRRSNRRRRAGCCPTCGYDLRATPGRCPECGRSTPGQTATTAHSV